MWQCFLQSFPWWKNNNNCSCDERGKIGKYQTKSDANWALRCWKFSIFLPLVGSVCLCGCECLSACPTVVCFPRIGFTIETRFDTGKTNLELIFCRRVSFRSVSVGPRRYLLLSLAVSICLCSEWHTAQVVAQKWVAPAWFFFASFRQDLHVVRFAGVSGCV